MIVNFVTAVLLLTSAIQGLILNSPADGTIILSGGLVTINVVAIPLHPGPDDGVTGANIVFTGQGGSTASTTISSTNFGQNIEFPLPSNFNAGSATVSAIPIGGIGEAITDTNNVTVEPAPTPTPTPDPAPVIIFPATPYPCYNPVYNNNCYNPCRNPISGNNCYNPCRGPVCNIPSPRCRIRDGSSSSQHQSNEEQTEQFNQAPEAISQD